MHHYAATLIGRAHRLKQQNCQDFATAASPLPGCAYGLVLDGCGSKQPHTLHAETRQPSHSEIGATLLGQFAAIWLHQQLLTYSQQTLPNPTATLCQALDTLHAECHSFLHQLTALFPWSDEAARSRFVAAHLLTTLVGFVVTPETAVFFWQGDGFLVHNGDITLLDSDNHPDYLAYHLLRPPSATPGFHIQPLPRAGLRWLAVATDGWQPALLTQLATPRPSLQLDRWLQVQAKQPTYFEDDGGLAIAWCEES